MNLSIFLAQLWGITFIVVSLALLNKPKLLERLLAGAENEAVMFFWGVVNFILGLVMVLAHNVWVRDWRVVITVLGWLTLAKGIDTLFLPERMKRRWARTKGRRWTWIFALLLIFGLVLTYIGFTA